jgi:hypothetical protein
VVSGDAVSTRSRLATAASVVLVLSVITGFLIGLVALVRALVRVFTHLDNQVAAAIVVASSAAVVSVASLIFTRVLEQRAERLRELRAKKSPVYERFITGWLDLLLNSKDGEVDQEKLQAFFQQATIDFTIWASDEVLVTWSRRRRAFIKAVDPMESMFGFEQLFLTVRKDLGHRNKNVQPGDLLGLWVNDVDDYLPGAKTEADAESE